MSWREGGEERGRTDTSDEEGDKEPCSCADELEKVNDAGDAEESGEDYCCSERRCILVESHILDVHHVFTKLKNSGLG